MINAKEAKEISILNDKDSNYLDLVEIEELIKEACNKGKYCIWYSNYLSIIIIDRLEEYGYQIENTNSNFGYEYIISWE